MLITIINYTGTQIPEYIAISCTDTYVRVDKNQFHEIYPIMDISIDDYILSKTVDKLTSEIGI
jgi:hypothetical protein